MNETAKAMRRRWNENAGGGIQWYSFFQGYGIDVGCGPDKVPFDECQPFDREDGDANYLSNYFPAKHFDYLHASQCLEHMHNPTNAVNDWLEVVKPGGYLILSVPSWETYEAETWPSRFNPDHKSSWSMIKEKAPTPQHIYVPLWVRQFNVEVVVLQELKAHYNPNAPKHQDQTWHESDGVELFIEFVFKKL